MFFSLADSSFTVWHHRRSEDVGDGLSVRAGQQISSAASFFSEQGAGRALMEGGRSGKYSTSLSH